MRGRVEDSLRYCCGSRIAYKNLLNSLSFLIIDQEFEEIEVPENLSGSVEFTGLLEKFESFLQHLHERKGSRFLTIPYIKAMVSSYLSSCMEYLEDLHKAYLSTRCRTETVDLYEGIGYFICELYLDLKNGIITERFKEAILRTPDRPNYKFLINNFSELDKTLQDYVLTGLVSQTYEKDWGYFFPLGINEIKYNSYTKLRDLQSLYEEFRAFIMDPYVKDKLSNFIPAGFRLDDVVDNLALDRVYILNIQPSLHGLTTHNGNIFLSDFGYDLNRLFPEEKVCILLTLIHELAHLLRRINCNDYNESRNKFTPKDDEDSELNLFTVKTESQIYKIRGEAGDKIEKMILGNSLSYINREAAIYLLNKDFENPQFRVILEEKNMSKESRAFMGKSKEPLANGIRCGFNSRRIS